MSVQILRGLAALLVVSAHAFGYVLTTPDHSYILWLGHWRYFCAIGVDIFFVISGFVMALSMAKYEGKPGSFLTQRWLRIVPLAWFVALATVLLGAQYGPKSALAVLTIIPVGTTYSYPFVNAMWTLSFEFVFYLLVAFALACRLGRWHLFAIICALASVGLIWNAGFPLLRWFTHPILFEFALGVLAFQLRGKISSPYLRLALVSGGVLILWQFFTSNEWIGHRDMTVLGNAAIYRALIWGLPIFLLFVVATHREPRGSVLSKAGQFLGDASYSLYLTHAFVLLSLFRFIPGPADVRYILSLALTVAVGSAVHWLVERPMMATFHSIRSNGLGKASAEPALIPVEN